MVNLILNIGICHYLNGGKYEGEWKNNKKHGKGKLLINQAYFIIIMEENMMEIGMMAKEMVMVIFIYIKQEFFI